MRYFEEELQEYVYDLCKAKNIPSPDIRFRCFGDINYFLSKGNSYWVLDCVSYYAEDTEDVKRIVSCIIDVLWRQATKPNHRIALYLKDIIDKGNWIYITIGGGLYEDDTLYEVRI